MALFDISVPSDAVSLAGRRGDVAFSVRNTGGRAVNGRAYFPKPPASAQPQPQKQAPDAWLSAADMERPFAPGQTHQFVVRVDVPADGAAGDYVFLLAVCDVDRPDDEYTEGPAVTFQVRPAAAPSAKPFPWWVVGVAAAVLLAVGVGAWLALRNRPVAVPKVAGLTFDEAARLVRAAGLKPVVVDLPGGDDVPDGAKLAIVGQKPAEGASVGRGSAVELTVLQPLALKIGEAGWDFDAPDGGGGRTPPDVTVEERPMDLPVVRLAAARAARLASVDLGQEGGAAVRVTRFGGDAEIARGAVGLPDGRLLAYGNSQAYMWSGNNFQGSSTTLVVARYLPDGRLDPSFGTHGRAAVPGLEATAAGGRGLSVLPDGAGYLVAGRAADKTAVVRLTAGGAIDRNFGADGTAEIVPPPGLRLDGLAVLVKSSDGKVLLVPQASGAGGPPRIGFARLDADGGAGGRALDPARWSLPAVPGRPPSLTIADAAVQPDGKVLYALRGDGAFSLARLNADGTVDRPPTPPIGPTPPADAPEAQPQSLAVRPDGTVFVAGRVNGRSQVARYGPNLVPGGSPGVADVTEALGSLSLSLALQPDNRLVVAGTVSRVGADPLLRWAVARYTDRGDPDPTFGGPPGQVGLSFLVGDSARLLNQLGAVGVTDGRVVVAGMGRGAFTLVRFNGDGTPDAAFGRPFRLRDVLEGKADEELQDGAPMNLPAAGDYYYLRTDRDLGVLIRVDAPFDPAAGTLRVSYATWKR